MNKSALSKAKLNSYSWEHIFKLGDLSFRFGTRSLQIS